MSYTVFYISEVTEEGETLWRVSSKRFATREAAQAYADGIAPSRKPQVAEIDN